MNQQTSTPELWSRIWEPEPKDDEFHYWVSRENASVRGAKIFDYVERHLGPIKNLKVIEVGSGPGIYSFLFAKRGARVTLLDYSPEALRLAKAHFEKAGLPAEYKEADALSLPSHFLGTFDVAMSFGTIEHYRYPERFLMAKRHVDLLRPGGIAAISVPNRWFLPHEGLKFILQKRKKWLLGYEGAFSRSELSGLSRKLSLQNRAIYGSSLSFDLKRYLHILANTQLFSRFMPNTFKTKPRLQPERRAFLDDYFGSDLVLMGRK